MADYASSIATQGAPVPAGMYSPFIQSRRDPLNYDLPPSGGKAWEGEKSITDLLLGSLAMMPVNMGRAAVDAVTAPGRAYNEGMTQDEMIQRSADLAGVLNMGGAGMPVMGGAAGMGRRTTLRAADDLPMDYASRMARAKEQGFNDRTFYHATPESFDQFDLRRSGTQNGIGTGEKAIFVTDSPKVAEDFVTTHWFTRDGKNAERAYVADANIMPLKVKNLDDYDVWDMAGGAYDEAFMDNALRQAKKAGRRGVIFTQMRDYGIGTTGAPRPSNVIASFKPEDFKSTAAKFDPAQSSSPNLLAANNPGAAPVGAAMIGGGDADIAAAAARKYGMEGEVY